jgi:hypothetical protein
MRHRPRKFNPIDWQGAIADSKPVPVVASESTVDDGDVSWFAECSPTYNQNGPSCVGQGWANWCELMVRRYIDPKAFKGGWQIEGEAIWRKARQMYYGGNMDGGLALNEGFLAAKELGIFPESAQSVRVANDWNTIRQALKLTPLVQGHHVHYGWDQPSTGNGCIDHAPIPTDSDGYHCTLRVAALMQGITQFYSLLNSWGPSWGWKGIGVMTAAEDQEGIMRGGLLTANGFSMSEFTGWKKYLKKGL